MPAERRSFPGDVAHHIRSFVSVKDRSLDLDTEGREADRGTEATEPGALPLRVRLGWGLGSMPMSALSITANVLVLRFMTDTLGIAAATAALAMSIAKIWDAVNDPLMGTICDRVNTPWGQRLPWMVVGGLLTPIIVVALFAAPTGSPAITVIYMVSCTLLFATTYTMFMIPYMIMPAEITSSYHGRTQLMSFRVVFSSLGSMAGMGLGPVLLATWGATQEGHIKMAAVICGLALLAVVMCTWLLREAPRGTPVRKAHPPIISQVRSTLSNRPFLWLLTAKVFYYMHLAFTLGTFAYFTKHVLKVSDVWLGSVLTTQTLVLIGSQPLWMWLGRRLGKRSGVILALGIFAAAHLSWWFAAPGDPTWQVIARSVVMGIGGGGTFLLTQAMLPDIMEYDRLMMGERREGMFAGVFVFVEKVAGAVGVAFVGVFLQVMGYVKSTAGVAVVQPASAILALYVCVSILPMLLCVAAAAVMTRYDLSPEKLAVIRLRAASA